MNLATIKTKDFGEVPVRHRDCPLCGRNNDDVVANRYSEHPWEIKECSGCRFVYIDRAPDYSMQFEVMAWERTTKLEEPRRAEIRPISYKASKRTRFRLHLFPRHSALGYIVKRAGGERP
jgi:rubredoxin